jgi:cell wall-associated NlpC family hydrolase
LGGKNGAGREGAGMSSLMRIPCFVVGVALLSASAWAQELPVGSLHAAPVQIQSGPDSPPSAPSWDQRLKRVANDFLGTRYRLGGSSQDTGLDCSGLIKQIWQRLGLADLPHQAAKMAKLGVPVQLRDIQVGDLVFFNTTGKQNSHVGVYIGDGRFVHASSVNEKVTENSLSESYYRKTFNGIRRVAGFDSASDAPAISE